MLRMAARFNKKYIGERRVDLRLSDGRSLPYSNSCFDKVYTVHTLYFWPQPLNYAREIARVSKPGGRFVLGFRTGGDPETRNFHQASTVFTRPMMCRPCCVAAVLKK